MAYKLIKVGKQFNVPVRGYVCDIYSELDTIDARYGDNCIVLATGKTYVKGTDGWYEASINGGYMPTNPDAVDKVSIQETGEYAGNLVFNNELYYSAGDTEAILGSYSLVNETGSTIKLNFDSSTYILNAELYTKEGELISETEPIDLPIESLVEDIQYDSETKEIVIYLHGGAQRRIPLGDLVADMATQTWVNENFAKISWITENYASQEWVNENFAKATDLSNLTNRVSEDETLISNSIVEISGLKTRTTNVENRITTAEASIDALEEEVPKKVAKFQGTEHEGKVMQVNSSGYLALAPMESGFKYIVVEIQSSEWVDKTCQKSVTGLKKQDDFSQISIATPLTESASAYFMSGVTQTCETEGIMKFTCETVPTTAIKIWVALLNGGIPIESGPTAPYVGEGQADFMIVK